MIRTLEGWVEYGLAQPARVVDRFGMYRVVSGGLVCITLLSVVAGATGLIAYGPMAQLASLATALFVALTLNIGLAALWRVPANHESAVITALILFFMMIPSASIVGNWHLAAGVALAILSKFLIVYRRQHILNPAATSAVLLAAIVGGINLLSGTTYNTDIFSWWVANPVLVWPVVLFGALIVFKVRRWAPVLAFIGVGFMVFLLENWRLGIDQTLLEALDLYFVSFPTLFLAFFMLTEPFTMPPTRGAQIAYGGLVGVLANVVLPSWFIPMTPELALVAGNVFAYTFRARQKLFLILQEKRKIAADTWEFIFTKPAGFNFQPGQYLEWMLPHESSDSRGPRRYFTIASSPTETVVRLACKIIPTDSQPASSSYKQALLQLDEGDELIASQLAGDFLLPSDTSTKLGFIAGGIGITPFRSHLQYMADSGNAHDTALYYCCNTMSELAYVDTFYSYDIPLEVIPVIAKETVSVPQEQGFVTLEMLERRTPDWRDRTWYLSGPPGMVNAYYKLLRDAGLPRAQIKKDFFPGLA